MKQSLFTKLVFKTKFRHQVRWLNFFYIFSSDFFREFKWEKIIVGLIINIAARYICEGCLINFFYSVWFVNMPKNMVERFDALQNVFPQWFAPCPLVSYSEVENFIRWPVRYDYICILRNLRVNLIQFFLRLLKSPVEKFNCIWRSKNVITKNVDGRVFQISTVY